MPFNDLVIEGFSALTILGHALLVLILVSFIPGLSGLRLFITRRTLVWMFIVALFATLGSLFFSEIADIVPCRLCWFQRIFMYPQTVLLFFALLWRDQRIVRYILPLCIIGGAIAAWHYGEHVWTAFHPADPSVPCSLDGISCAVPPFWHFGYVTIPLMALTAFVLNAVGSIAVLRQRA